MEELGIVEDTLFVPMLGRIYAGEHCPGVLYDPHALRLKEKLPQDVLERIHRQSEYSHVAAASRSANMDRFIQEFLQRSPEGVIVQLGVGLETTFLRNDNGSTRWYSVDLPNVIAYRQTLLPESPREIYLGEDAFSKNWLTRVRTDAPAAPILVIASGLFYYFEEETILSLFRMLQNQGEIEVVFDTVNKSGMSRMQKKYMKEVGHENARMYFFVDSASELAAKIGGSVRVLAEEPYYQQINKQDVKATTKLTMMASDLLHMVKMIHLHLE